MSLLAALPAQYEAYAAGRIPTPQVVAPGVWVVAIPYRDPFVPYTLCYLFLDANGDVHVLDPGWGTDTNWDILRIALGDIGRSVQQVASITVTHLHVDHFDMAKRLARASGAPILAHRLERAALLDDAQIRAEVYPLDWWGVPHDVQESIRPPVRTPIGDVSELTIIPVDDGDRLLARDTELRAVHTPGHTTGHLCVVAPHLQLVFTGDHVLPVTRPGFGLGATDANPLRSYLNSLRKLETYGAFVVHPGHEYAFRGLTERCEDLRRHHLARAAEIAAIIAADPTAPVWEVASRVSWTAGWANLDGNNLRLALMQTAAHLARQLRECEEPPEGGSSCGGP